MDTREINHGLKRDAQLSTLSFELINTLEVQRLEEIVNNGMGSKAFPGLRHSRLSHVMGTADMGREIYFALNRNGSKLPETFLYLFEALGITHDLGHSPFGHALRNVIEKTVGKSHETISALIVKGDLSFVDYFLKKPHLLGNESFITQILNNYKRFLTVPQILYKHGVNKDLIVQALCPSVAETPLSKENSFVKQIIDGCVVDIDKFDYIRRDATFGNIRDCNADPSRVLNGLKIVEVNGGRYIALVDSALDDLCRWVSARKYMYCNVYTHKTVLKFEAMLC